MRIFKFWLMLLFFCSSIGNAQSQPPAKVAVSKIVFQTVAMDQTFIGTLYYERVSNLSSEVAGLVNRIDVKTGDHVKKWMTLVYLDTEILEK